jgi:lipid-A-disaccharide synthase
MAETKIMVIAGEPSGDALAAELVQALQAEAAFHAHPQPPALRFFGAGGPKLAAAGVELAVDLTRHAVIGLWEVLKNYGAFRRVFDELLALAEKRQPDLLVCVDFSGFNRRFAHALRQRAAKTKGRWQPRIVQYVSPQVWASRPGRAAKMADDYDLLLSIFPFEKDWYAQRAPKLRVEFIGHPILDRFPEWKGLPEPRPQPVPYEHLTLLLPGSRAGELARHLPPMLDAARRIGAEVDSGFLAVLPSEALLPDFVRHCATACGVRGRLPSAAGKDLAGARGFVKPLLRGLDVQIGRLPEALRAATMAIASTGTVTMECAFFRVPTLALYRTSWSTYQIGKRIITVSHLAMPNLLAGREIYPEFVQDAATGPNLAAAALALLRDPERRAEMRTELDAVIARLGSPGANVRAAKAVWTLLESESGDRR